MRLVMTLLVCDEADIVGDTIAYHLAHGVDHVVVTDNSSTDGSVEIVEDYVRAGVADLRIERDTRFRQAGWVTHMARFARDRRGADSILNCDADEFWHHPSGSLKSGLDRSEAAIIMMRQDNMLPPADDAPGTPIERMRLRVDRPGNAPDVGSLLNRQKPKALCRAAGLSGVTLGNHNAGYVTEVLTDRDNPWRGYHYPIRSPEHFARKVAKGIRALDSNPGWPPGVSRHWRLWRKRSEAGLLDETYAALRIPEPQRAALLAAGVLVEDDTILRARAPASATAATVPA